jgi:hypothetical protein
MNDQRDRGEDRGRDRIPGSDAGEEVGLGRVVEDRRAVGSPDPEDPGAEDAEATVSDASADSFPASDPPMWRDVTATPEGREPPTDQG